MGIWFEIGLDDRSWLGAKRRFLSLSRNYRARHHLQSFVATNSLREPLDVCV
jgi:hypothetical protein